MRKHVIAVLAGALLALGATSSSGATCASVQDTLSANKAAVQVTCIPAGATQVGVAELKTLTGSEVKYGRTIPVSVGTQIATDNTAYPVIDIQAKNSSGATVGGWAGRLQTVPGGEAPKETKRTELEKRLAVVEASVVKLGKEEIAAEELVVKLSGELGTAQSLVQQIRGEISELPAEESQAEREAREKAERESREKAEHEAKEKAEREAREKAEREAREKAEREQHEREEREKLEEPVLTGFAPGVNLGANTTDYQAAQLVGGKLARIEFSLNRSELANSVVATAKQTAPYGIKLQPLFGASGRIPSESEARNLGNVASALRAAGFTGPIHFELMNESSYGYQYGDGASSGSYKERARRYAVLVKVASEAVKPYGVGILAQAEDGGSGSSAWDDEMFASVPNLSSYVAGWVIHPYSGQKSASERDTSGLPKMERMVAALARHGDTTTPIDVTEYGEPSENGTTLSDGKHLTFAEAGQVVTSGVPALKAAAKAHPIHSFIIYQDRDQRAQGTDTEREHYFGILTTSNTAKGAYTTVIKNLLAQ